VLKFVRERSWWGFCLLIAAPALVLALLGLRTVELQRAERLHQNEAQQGQTHLLADSTLSGALSQLEMNLARRPGSSSRDGPCFTLDRAGTLVFWSDRVYFADPGREPAASRFAISATLQVAADAAMGAEAQSDVERALALYRQIGRHRELSAWAALRIARLQTRELPEILMDGFSPSGTPVALLAAADASQIPQVDAARIRPFVRPVLDQLRSGRWWLSYEQRRLHDSELQAFLGIAGGDSRLTELGAIEQAIGGLSPFRRDAPSRQWTSQSGSGILLIMSPQAGENGHWTGIALSGDNLSRFVEDALGPIRTTVSYPLALADSTGRILWGEPAAAAHAVFPLRAIPGLELLAGEPASTNDVRQRWLWYGFLAVLFAMLIFGMTMTARIVTREMELARLQAEFSASVTHEFKSPITGIRLLVERIASGRVLNPASIREYCAAVHQQTDHLDHLVNRLLETHRIQSGQKHYQIAPHCVTEIAEEAIAHLRTQADAKRIAVTLVTDDAEREINLDRTAIQDSVENLLENAIKYSPQDTHISITIFHSPGELNVTVRDEGIGIDPSDLPRIFDRFYRGRRGHAQSVTGTGLGLALVKAAAEGHGGTVEAESAPGQGSEFRIRIPIRKEEMYVPGFNR
jgi:signal transduction histidine kinase